MSEVTNDTERGMPETPIDRWVRGVLQTAQRGIPNDCQGGCKPLDLPNLSVVLRECLGALPPDELRSLLDGVSLRIELVEVGIEPGGVAVHRLGDLHDESAGCRHVWVLILNEDSPDIGVAQGTRSRTAILDGLKAMAADA